MEIKNKAPERGSHKSLLFLFAISFFAWIYCFKGFLLGRLYFTSDAVSYYNHIKFLADYLNQGTFPLWDPNWNNGVDNEFFLRRMGGFNPFFYLLVILRKFGIPHTSAYLIFLSFYWFVGVIGFFKLAQCLYKQTSVAFLCSLLLLFSSLGTRLFDSYIILTFVPMVWFFYFLTAFTEKPQKYFLLGGTLSLMLLMTTYIPLYFLLIFLIFLLLFSVFYFKRLKPIFLNYIKFASKHKFFTCFCLIAVLLSFIPGLMIFKAAGEGKFVMPQRSYLVSSADNVFEVAKATIMGWAILEEFVYASAFWDLHRFKFAVIYVPAFAFLIFVMGLITASNKRFIFLFLWGFIFFLIGTPGLSPFYEILSDRVFFFKFFRNLHFFLWWNIVPVFILLVGEQLQQVLYWKTLTKPAKTALIAWTIVVHAGFTVFIYSMGGAILSTYFVIAASFLFFIFYFNGWLASRKGLLLLAILIVTALQPLEVYHYLNQNSARKTGLQKYDSSYMGFSYTGPNPYMTTEQKKSITVLPESNPPSLYYVGKWFNVLRSNINYYVLQEYLSHKFLVYDRVAGIDPLSPDYKRVEAIFWNDANVAFVGADQFSREDYPAQMDHSAFVQKLTADSDEFKVLDYSANYIKVRTNFSSRKFLVYNDAFDKAWQAFINGEKAELFRANVAFKGLWIPPGENIVYLKYGTLGTYFINYLLIILFNLVFVLLLLGWIQTGMDQKKEGRG